MPKRKMDVPAHRPTARALREAREESGRHPPRTPRELAQERLRHATIAHAEMVAAAERGEVGAAALAEVAEAELERAREQLARLNAQERQR